MHEINQYHPVADVIDRISLHGSLADDAKQVLRDKRSEYKQYLAEHGEHMPEIRQWNWTSREKPAPRS
jgi:xylulose-5-phosphate/fructose-6-phosphate phosphoketolase